MNIHLPKKSLGQNFLKSKEALREIIKAGEVGEKNIVLEIGPGKGVLTDAMLQTGASVIAIEKDDRLIPLLQEKFSTEIANKKLELIHGDVLKFNLPSKLTARSYKLIANLPYYITGQIIRKFLESDRPPSKIVFMLQKEVAKRISSKDKESILSISVKAYGTPKYVMTVDRKYFSPEPNVDSAVLLIDDINKKFFNDIPEEFFFAIIKQAFSHKRKKLVNNLDFPKDILEKIFKELEIETDRRAEDTTIDDFKKITEHLAKAEIRYK